MIRDCEAKMQTTHAIDVGRFRQGKVPLIGMPDRAAKNFSIIVCIYRAMPEGYTRKETILRLLAASLDMLSRGLVEGPAWQG